VETGVLGLLAFIWLFRLALRASSRLKAASDQEVRNTGLWLFWSFVMLIWALSMDHVSGAPTYKYVFFLFGMAVGAARLAPVVDDLAAAAEPASGAPGRPPGTSVAA